MGKLQAAPLLAFPTIPSFPTAKTQKETEMGRFHELANRLGLSHPPPPPAPTDPLIALPANDHRAAPPPPQPIQGRPEPKGTHVWRVVVDGKGMTVIDPHRRTLDQMRRDMAAKFGPDRVTGVDRLR